MNQDILDEGQYHMDREASEMKIRLKKRYADNKELINRGKLGLILALVILIIRNAIIYIKLSGYDLPAYELLFDVGIFGALYIFCYLMLEKNAVLGLSLGLIGYLSYQILFYLGNPASLFQWFLIKLVIIGFLIIGIMGAYRIRKMKAEMKRYGLEQ